MSETISLNTDTENQSLRKIEKDSSLSLGQYGAVYTTTSVTAATGVSYGAIQALEASTFSSLTASNWSGTLGGMQVPAGVTIFGNFTALVLSSGRVVAYKNA
jgi:hypothetical protein